MRRHEILTACQGKPQDDRKVERKKGKTMPLIRVLLHTPSPEGEGITYYHKTQYKSDVCIFLDGVLGVLCIFLDTLNETLAYFWTLKTQSCAYFWTLELIKR